MSDIKLKPCPSCNGRAEMGYGDGCYYVYCAHCNTCGAGEVDCHPDAEEQAGKEWNSLPRRLHWTNETPTEAGWYFSRANSIVNVVLLGSSPEGLCVLDGGKCCPINGFSHGGRAVEWAGPIQLPKEAEK